MPSTLKKVIATLQSIIAFLAVSAPFTYKTTNAILGGKLANSYGCPTSLGLFIHAIVFGAIVYGLMTINSQLSVQSKLSATLQSILVFALVSLPFTYTLTNNILGGMLANASGCPTLLGLFIHSIVFGVIIYNLM